MSPSFSHTTTFLSRRVSGECSSQGALDQRTSIALDAFKGVLDGMQRTFEHLGEAAVADQQAVCHAIARVVLM